MDFLPLVAVLLMMAMSIGVGTIAKNTTATKEYSRKQLEFLDYISGLLEDEFGKGKKKTQAEDRDNSGN